jgi:putative endonuclease
MPDLAYVHIMASSYKHLYIGVTSEIEIRIWQHKEGRYPDSFTSRYRIDRLVYFERFVMIEDAIARETQLKKWSRIKKIRLIIAANPTWNDLSSEWGKPSRCIQNSTLCKIETRQAKCGDSSTVLCFARNDAWIGGKRFPFEFVISTEAA